MSVAIHRATGGCEAYTTRKQAVRISTEIFSRPDADVFSLAEGSIRHDRYCEVARGSAVSLAQGMFHRDWPGTQESSPSPPRPQRNASGCGLEVRATKGRPEEARKDAGAVLQPHSTDEGGEPQGSCKGWPRHPLEGRGKQTYESVERRHIETQNSRNYVNGHRQNS